MASTVGRDPFFPTAPKGRAPALGLALFAHGLLLLALALGVNWRTAPLPTMAAELWSAVPQAAAPRAAPPPPEPSRPQPIVKPAPPKPEPQALPDPQIAIEKANRDEAKRLKAEQDEKLEVKRERSEREKAEKEKQKEKQKEVARLKDEAAQKKSLAEKQKAEKQRAELAKAEQADAARDNAIREQNLKRLQGLAGASGGPGDTGTALRSSAPSAGYAGRIVARIKPNIVFNEPVDGNPIADIEVKLAPDGTIVGKRVVKGSSSRLWDEAVLRAIERTEILPRDADGRVPASMTISFKLRD